MAKQYWVQHEGKTSGPFSDQQLKQMAAADMIAASDLISADQISWTVREGFFKLLTQGESPTTDQGATLAAQPASLAVQEPDLVVDSEEQAVGDPPELAPATVSQPPAQRPEDSLHQAARLRDIPQIKLHLAWGADINLKDNSGKTPLHEAVESASLAPESELTVVEFLLTNKADVNVADAIGVTPLHMAAAGQNGRLVELLITLGANVEAEDTSGNTPLHSAIKYYLSTEAIRPILTGGPSVFTQMMKTNKSDETPLHIIASNAHLEAAKIVFEALQAAALNGIQFDEDQGKRAPLDMTKDALIECLMEDPSYHHYYRSSIDHFINMQDNGGRTPLERMKENLFDRILEPGYSGDYPEKRELADILRAHGAKRSPLWYRGPLTPKNMSRVFATLIAVGIGIASLFGEYPGVVIVIVILFLIWMWDGFNK